VVISPKERLEATLLIDDRLNTSLLSRVKINPWNIGMNIHRKRIASEADEAGAIGKVFHTDIFNGGPKGGERRTYRLGDATSYWAL
jgi:hypothetical protein